MDITESKNEEVMFEKLLNKVEKRRYNVISDYLYTGGNELISDKFISRIVIDTKAEFFIYLTIRNESNLYRSRFLSFNSLGRKMKFIYEHKGLGYSFIDELALMYMN